MTVWHMHIACCIPKTTNTHAECVTLIAFPLQHWFHGCASMLCYMYSGCLYNVTTRWSINLDYALKGCLALFNDVFNRAITS